MERRCCICGGCFANLVRVRQNGNLAKQVKVLFDIIIAYGRITSFVCQQCKEIVLNMHKFYIHVMDTQKLLLNADKQQNEIYCRLCGCAYKNLTSIFHESHLPSQINELFQVIVTPEDTLPTIICEPCREIISNNLKFYVEVRKVQKMFNEFSNDGSVQIDPQYYNEITNILDNLPSIYGSRISVSEDEDFETSFSLSNQQVVEVNNKHMDDKIETALEHIKEEDLDQKQSLNNANYNTEEINKSTVNDDSSTVIEAIGHTKVDNNTCSSELSKSEDIRLWTLSSTYSKVVIPHRLLKRVRSANGGDVFKCICCTKPFKSTWDMFLHERGYFMTKYKENRCKKCSRVFDTKHCFSSHTMLHKKIGDFQCDKCSKSFLFKIDIDTHIRAHQNRFLNTCPICELDFKTASELRIHGNTHRTGYSKQQYPYYCAVCGCGHFTKQKASSHILLHELKQDVRSLVL